MKWNDAYIILLDAEDEMLLSFSNALKTRYGIPSAKSYANVACPGYTSCSHGFLAHASLGSKIIVVSHANVDTVLAVVDGICGGYLPHRFANFLAEKMKLVRCGLIAFKGCNIGTSQYLNNLSDALSDINHVQHGWLIGYCSGVSPIGALAGVGIIDTLIRGNPLYPKMPDSWRVKVVQGNVTISPPSGSSKRYS